MRTFTVEQDENGTFRVRDNISGRIVAEGIKGERAAVALWNAFEGRY